MKKIFTLICALAGFAGTANAASVDDLAVCKHSYVLVCDEYTNNGTGSRTKGGLFGDGYFLDVTGGSVATNKGNTNLSVVNEADDNHVTQAIADKYGAAYPDAHLNSLRLKNAQDVIAMKITNGSKLIFFIQGNYNPTKPMDNVGTKARYPKIATDAALTNTLNSAPTADSPGADAGFRYEWTADDDYTIYIGSYNGDMFVSYIIVEANEAEGTPSVKVGGQTYEGGLWYREVTCTPQQAYGMDTEVYYTVDGSEPSPTNGTLYTEPIKCYKDMMVKFQASLMGQIIPGADNEAPVSFSFNAPAINADGANVTIVSEYEGAKNFVTLDGNLESAEETSEFTLDESATVTAFSRIVNGEYATFETKSTKKDVYVLNPIKEKKTIAVTAGEVVVDEEATKEAKEKDASAADVLVVKDGAISADKMDFFVKDLEFGIVQKNDTANYQVPDGQEVYIKMNKTNITFFVAEGDSVDVVVTCSKNACKNINSDTASDRQCYVNIDGNKGGEDLKENPEGNVIKFGLAGGKYYTFQKYSGTGNILISSIEITPVAKQEGVLGDVNGDGKVDVEDVVGIVNKILGEPAEGFIEANADVNGDSKIDVDDVVAAVNIILGDTNE